MERNLLQPLGRRLYYGWYVLAAVSGINFANSATAIGVLTVFIIPLSMEFGWTRTQISVATSVGAVLGALVAPLAGRMTDRLGARLPLTLGGLSIVLATLYLATMQSLLGFYVAFGLARLADQGLVQAPSAPAIAKWFRRYRGRAMAVLFFTTSAGGMILPLLVHLVIRTWHWRIAWVVLSAIMLCLGLIPCALLVRRQPEDLGLLIDGGPQQPVSLASISDGEVSDTSSHNEYAWRLGEALRTLTLWLLLIAAFVVGIASTGVGLHLVPYLRQQGITPTIAVGAVSLGFLASGVGNLLWGVWADRFAVRTLLAVAYSLRVASLAVLLVANSLPEAYTFAVLQGFAEGGMRTVTAVLLADYYGRQSLGSIYGLLRAVQVAGFALGPLLSGAAYDLTQQYSGAFAVFLMLSIVGTVLIVFATPPLYVRQISHEQV
jgi:OFA family oxalate/formate antiporter-like MFS transporter